MRCRALRTSKLAACRARTKSRMASCTGSGTQMATRSPARNKRARATASRWSFFTRPLTVGQLRRSNHDAWNTRSPELAIQRVSTGSSFVGALDRTSAQ